MTDTWVEDAAAAVEALDTDVAAYLPDTVVAPLADAVDDSDARLVRVVREEAAVGVLSGAWIGGQRGVLICQSSGLANCFNALA